MKSRILWLAVVFLALAGFYYTTIRPAMTPAPRRLDPRALRNLPAPEMAMPALPMPQVDMPVLTPPPLSMPPLVFAGQQVARPAATPEVPIQSGTTIDFSTGGPMIRAQPEDQAAIDRALSEMSEAVKNTTFEPAGQKAAPGR